MKSNDSSVVEGPVITAASPMSEVLAAYPGAQRALFRGYHIGGCSSCAFQPTETLEQVCRRNQIDDVEAVLAHIRSSHEQDRAILIAPAALRDWMEREKGVRLVDVRSRDEFEAVHIPGSVLLSQPVMQEILGEGTNSRPLVVVDHAGRQGLDAAAYFLGHGLQIVRCLEGGIDAWAREIDHAMPRYRLG